MLRYLRENSGNWIIKIFLGIIVIVFVFLGVGTMNSDRNNTIASINDEPITLNEFQDEYRSMVERYRLQFGDNLNEDLLKALNVKQQALDSIIEQRLLEAEADKLDVRVSNRELEGVLLGIAAFQKDGAFDLEQYKRVLSVNSMNPEIFEQLQRASLRRQKVQDMVVSSITVSDMEAENWYRLRNAKVSVDYIKVEPDAFKDVVPTQEQIAAEYDANKAQYKSAPQRKAAFLKFSPLDFEDRVSISQEAVKTYYEENSDRFKTPEKVEARHILIKVDENAGDEAVETARKEAVAVYQKAVGGEDFAELAKTHSQGPSASGGGSLGAFARGQMVKPFEDKAFSMKAGEISEPVRTRFGWHVIKVTAKFDASVESLEQVAEKIEAELAKTEMQNLAYDEAGKAFDAVIDGDSFEQVGLISKKEVSTTQPFSQDGMGLDMEGGAGFAGAAFATPLDEISDVKQLGDDYYLIKVVEIIEPSQLPLASVKDEVADALTLKLRKEAAKVKANEVAGNAKSNNSLEAAAEKAGLSLAATELFTRNGTVKEVGRSETFNTAAFSLSQDAPVYNEAIETAKGFFIISLKEKQLPDQEEIAGQLDTAKQQLRTAKQRQYYRDWMAELKAANKVEIDPRFIN